jgi:hypothetical protein
MILKFGNENIVRTIDQKPSENLVGDDGLEPPTLSV